MLLYKLCFYLLMAAAYSADLQRMLRHFETLGSNNLRVATKRKRNVDGKQVDYKQIHLRTLEKTVRMVLTPGSSVMGQNFKASTVDGKGKKEKFFVDPNNFYSGFLEDDRAVEVDAHYENGILSANVYYPNDTLVIEPAQRYRLRDSNVTMIAYHHSDVNWEEMLPIDPKTGNRTRMRDGIRLSAEDGPVNLTHEPQDTVREGKGRQKRGVRRNICKILVVADYLFFKSMGGNERRATAASIITIMQNVNRYFRRTVFDENKKYVNMGFVIHEMIIHTNYTSTTRHTRHYNSEERLDYRDKLYIFDSTTNLHRICLGHLFTSTAFSDNVLGIAFTGTDMLGMPGGICSRPRGNQNFRSGATSALNSKNEQVVTAMMELVVTHELGHNWGSLHDPVSEECAPDGRDNGKFVMWPISVPGYDKNNRYFSPCSKRSITAVLEVKSQLCFSVEGIHHICGNAMIEASEECDPGIQEVNEKEDPCCTRDCKLRKGAVCSDFNYACCKDCQPAASSVECSEVHEMTCKNKVFCDGTNLDCGEPGPLADNTSCIDMGTCVEGQCLSFCVIRGRLEGRTLTPCLCSQNDTAMCRRCCAEVNGEERGECLPTDVLLAPGRPCLTGYCDEIGKCKQNLVLQQINVPAFISLLKTSSLAEFCRKNIVGLVIVITLVMWIPASTCISSTDRKEKEEILRKVSACTPAVTKAPIEYDRLEKVNSQITVTLSGKNDKDDKLVHGTGAQVKFSGLDIHKIDEEDEKDTDVKGTEGKVKFSGLDIHKIDEEDEKDADVKGTEGKVRFSDTAIHKIGKKKEKASAVDVKNDVKEKTDNISDDSGS